MHNLLFQKSNLVSAMEMQNGYSNPLTAMQHRRLKKLCFII